jgi:cyclopropane fatty-acyl-phospholipid synthase-like methyltransferase
VHVLEQTPSQEHLDSYYASNYAMSANEILASEHRRLFRIPEQFWLISQLQKYGLERSSSVLDIGCDKGYFLDQCRRFGYSVKGVEPSDSARAYCATIGLDIRQHISELNSTVDAITMWHVLEHFTDPKTLIKQCHTLLNENGILFIRVPNFSSFWSKILGKYWIWFQPQNHYVHYSQKALQYLVESNGFDILTCESRKPNNIKTFKAGLLADKTLKKSFSYIQPLKKRLGRIYEHITGVEIYLVAKKR